MYAVEKYLAFMGRRSFKFQLSNIRTKVEYAEKKLFAQIYQQISSELHIEQMLQTSSRGDALGKKHYHGNPLKSKGSN